MTPWRDCVQAMSKVASCLLVESKGKNQMTTSLRVPAIEPGTRSELADLEAAIKAERGGDIALLYQVLLNSAPIASGWEKMLTAVRNRTSVPANLRELIILRVAILNRASFEFEAHVPCAQRAGVSQAKIDSLHQWPRSASEYDDDERLVLELTDHMTRDIEVPDTIMNRVCKRFDHREMVEIIATVAAYNMVSRFLVALNIVH